MSSLTINENNVLRRQSRKFWNSKNYSYHFPAWDDASLTDVEDMHGLEAMDKDKSHQLISTEKTMWKRKNLQQLL